MNKSTPWPSSPPYPTSPDASDDACWPFEDVRHAAHRLVDRMYFPYDRIAIVTFGRLPTVWLELDDTDLLPAGCSPTDPKACAHVVLDQIEVEPSPLGPPPLAGCEVTTPRGCMPTNIGDGLLQSGARFCVDDNPTNGTCDRAEMREEAVWITILLTDGATNAAIGSGNPNVSTDWICPESTYTDGTPPWCVDDDPSYHDSSSIDYDADDYARDQADIVGCPGPGIPPPAGCPAAGGVGSVIFTIGLGTGVTNHPAYTVQPDAGAQLLRYIAAVGIDGQPTTDPFCSGVTDPEVSCGNYYFAPEGPELIEVFEDIASRIFTRITH